MIRQYHNHTLETNLRHCYEELHITNSHKVRKKTKIRNRYNQVPNLTQNTIWISDKNKSKHYIQESQEASPFTVGGHKATRNRQDRRTFKVKQPGRSSPSRFVCLFAFCFTSQVNSYGHCGTVSSPYHTFSWAGLNKRLTSNSCTYFRL